jgi:hypothetical protein
MRDRDLMQHCTSNDAKAKIDEKDPYIPDLPARTFNKLDFPAPDGPIIAATFPDGT